MAADNALLTEPSKSGRAHFVKTALALFATAGCLPGSFASVVFVFTIVTLHGLCNFLSGKCAVMLRTEHIVS